MTDTAAKPVYAWLGRIAGALALFALIAWGIISWMQWQLIRNEVVPEVSRLHAESTAGIEPETVGDAIIIKNYHKCMNDSIARTGDLIGEKFYRSDAVAGAAARYFSRRSASCLNKMMEASSEISGAGRMELLASTQKLMRQIDARRK